MSSLTEHCAYRILTHDLVSVLQPIFRVMGFSVMGRVLNSVGGEGVPDATVSLNNQIKGRGRLEC